MFAIDLDQLRAGQPAVVDTKIALGYPVPLASLPPGDYYAQAIVNVYEPVKRADGKTIWVHMNDGTQEVMQIAAGNMYSDVQKITVARAAPADGEAAHHEDHHGVSRGRQDTEWVKRVRIQSQKLTAFWGRPIYMHATVLLPKGYNEHTSVRYPTVYTFGHNVPFNLQPDSTRVRNVGQINPVTGVETGYDFYKSWVSDRLPAIHRRELRAGDAVLPRLVLGELGEQRPVRRCDGRGSDSGAREAVPHDRQAVRASRRRRVDGRMADAGAAAQASRLLRRRVGAAAGSDRLPPLPARGHLHGHERVRDA